MGKKKKKAFKPWCYYCEREFDDEKILIQHQKAKHFKCHVCHKKLSTAGGMVVHVLQVHKENVVKVPNSKPGRESTEIEIFGMEGIPPEVMEKHTGEVDEDRQPPAKSAKMELPLAASTLSGAHPAAPGMTPQSMLAAVPPVLMPPQLPTLQPSAGSLPARPGWPSTTSSSSGWSSVTTSSQGWPNLRSIPGQPPILPPPSQLRLNPPPQPLFPIQGVRQPGSTPQQPLFPINGPSNAGSQSAQSSIRPISGLHPPIAPIPRPLSSIDSSTSSASLLMSSSAAASMGQARSSAPPVVLPPPTLQPRLYSLPPPGSGITPPSTDAISDVASLGSAVGPPRPPGAVPSLASGMSGPLPSGINPLAQPGGLTQMVHSSGASMPHRGISIGPRTMVPPSMPPPSVPPPSLPPPSLLPPSIPPPSIPPPSIPPPSIPPPSVGPPQVSHASLGSRAIPPVAPPLGPPPLGLPVAPPSVPPPLSSSSQPHLQLQAQPPVPPPPPYPAASRTQAYELPPSSSSMYAPGPTMSGGTGIGPPLAISRAPPIPLPSSEVYLVWDDEQMSMEERRALLPRYMVLDEMGQMDAVEAAIERRILESKLVNRFSRA